MTTQMRMDPWRHGPLYQYMRTPAVGQVFYVSTAARGALDANDGKTPQTAFLTIDYAVGQCTGAADDYIYVIEHDNAAATFPIVVDTANVHIIGYPETGRPMPDIRLDADVDGFDVTADRVEIAGFLIENGADAYTNRLVDVTGHGFHFHDNYVAWFFWAWDGLYIAASNILVNNNYFGAHGCANIALYVGAGQGRVIIRDNVFIQAGYDACVRCVEIVSQNHCVIIDNKFMVDAAADGEAIYVRGTTNMITGNEAAGPNTGMGAFNPYRNLIGEANSWGINYAGATPTLPVVS